MVSNLTIDTQVMMTADEITVRDTALAPEEVVLLSTLLRNNSSVMILDLSNTALCGLNPFGHGTFQTLGVSALTQALINPDGPARCLRGLY